MSRILIVEDENKVRKFLKEGLEHAGFHAVAVDNLEVVDTLLQVEKFDAAIVDRLVGSMDSISLLKRFKRLAPQTKFIILSALSNVEQRVSGLDEGADDYIPKPFHLTEVVAKLKAHLRTHQPESTLLELRVGDLTLNLDTQQVFRGDKTISLTSKEFRMLSILAKKPNKIFSKEEFLDRVWDVNSSATSTVVEVAMTRLRSKLESVPGQCKIFTKRGSGYFISSDTHAHQETD